jgi:hypothetical protein
MLVEHLMCVDGRLGCLQVQVYLYVERARNAIKIRILNWPYGMSPT